MESLYKYTYITPYVDTTTTKTFTNVTPAHKISFDVLMIGLLIFN